MRENQRNNKILEGLKNDDQEERKHWSKNWERITENDAKRRRRVLKILEKGQVKTGEDYYNAGLIFQHGSGTTDIKQARKLALASIKKGFEPAKWLYAATTDRMLVYQGKKQKYGTQYEPEVRSGKNTKKFVLSPYDKRTSDKTRAKYGIPPLKELLEMERVHTQKLSKKRK